MKRSKALTDQHAEFVGTNSAGVVSATTVGGRLTLGGPRDARENRGQLDVPAAHLEAMRFLDSFKTPAGERGTGAKSQAGFSSVTAWEQLNSGKADFFIVLPRPNHQLMSVKVKSWDDLVYIRHRAGDSVPQEHWQNSSRSDPGQE